MKKVLSLLLVLVMAFSMVAMTSCGKDKGDNKGNESASFDYSKLDIENYISLEKSDYTNVTLEIDVKPEITDESVEEFIQYLLEQNADSETKTDVAVEKGDTVKIYYRGTVDGVDFEGGSNMSASQPDPLKIGSGAFIPGFEDALIGIVPNTTSYTKVTSGTVKDDYVVYVSYTYTFDAKEEKVTSERIDLANTDKYDEAFIANIVGKTVGTAFTFTADVDVNGDGEKENVAYDMKVTFASIEETTPIEVTFPDPYKNNEELSGKKAIFYVVITELGRPVIPELTEELVKKSMGFESENKSTGDAYLAEFREYVRKSLTETRESTIKSDALNKLIEILMEEADVKEYPQAAIDEVTTYYNEQLKYYFEGYSQQYSDFPYETEEEFAPDFFGIPEGTSYEEWLKNSAEEEVRYNLIVNYLISAEKIKLTKDEKAEQIKALSEYYAAYYTQYYGQTYTADQILEMRGEESLVQEALYNKVFEFLGNNITIVENIVEEDESAESTDAE